RLTIKDESDGRALRSQSAIHRCAKLKGVGPCDFLPSGACNLQRFGRNVPAQYLFRFLKTDSHLAYVVAFCFPAPTAHLSCPLCPRKRTLARVLFEWPRSPNNGHS